jgi:hypothetical protein
LGTAQSNDTQTAFDTALSVAHGNGYARRGIANNVGPIVLRWTDQDPIDVEPVALAAD